MLARASFLPNATSHERKRTAPPVAVVSRRVNGQWAEIGRYVRWRKGDDLPAVVMSPLAFHPTVEALEAR
jgi:hypothetical protein